MNAIKNIFLGLTLFTGIAHADVSKTCAENCVKSSQVGNSLVFTLMDIHGHPFKVVTVELPSGAELLGTVGPNTKARFTEIEHGSIMMDEGGPRATEPGDESGPAIGEPHIFMDVISNHMYTTETHYVTVHVFGSYTYNGEGIIVLLDVTTQISKKPKDEDREQKAK